MIVLVHWLVFFLPYQLLFDCYFTHFHKLQHSLKFVAALHHAIKSSKYQNNPLLLRVYQKAGHGAGKPTSKKIEEATDILAFLYKTLKVEEPLE